MMKSIQSSSDYSELNNRIEEVQRNQAKLEGALGSVVKGLKELGFKTPKSASTWIDASQAKIEELEEQVEKEASIVEAKLDEYDESQNDD